MKKTNIRDIALAWHGGQSSPLYAYGCTGAILPGLKTEIKSCLQLAGNKKDIADLERLLNIVENEVVE